MSKLLDTLETDSRIIREHSYYLSSLGDSFYRTGNDFMGEALQTVANEMLESVDNINHAIAEDINESVQRSYEQIGETFKAIIDLPEQGD